MAKLPSGWIIIPRMTYKITIELIERKLVTCAECEYAECEGRDGLIVCCNDGAGHRPDWFCADGEMKEDENADD